LGLDREENKKYLDSHELNQYIKSRIKDKKMYYILLDEIQLVPGFESVLNGIKDVSINTITSYLNYLVDAFLIEKVERYDVKGKKYISTPSKYYFSDIELRNARLDFGQVEENHIMENIIYNELLIRVFNVDVGVVEIRENGVRKQLEVDFVCNQAYKKYYIQVALNLDIREKTIQEERPLMNIDDNFKKNYCCKR